MDVFFLKPGDRGFFGVREALSSMEDRVRIRSSLYRGVRFPLTYPLPKRLDVRFQAYTGLFAYDLIIFDCPPAIGYQSMNAVFAADVLYIPSGPGYWEYDSTTSFIGQLSEALEDLGRFRGRLPSGTDPVKAFADIKFLLTRFEPNNDLHRAMQSAFNQVFKPHVAEHPIEMTRAVEQSGRFLSSIYEMDYRQMTRETWRRARASFDRAYDEFRATLVDAWDKLEDE